MMKAQARICLLYTSHKGTVTGLATGFYDLDYKTSGFQPSDLILVAARPSMGKTAVSYTHLDVYKRQGKLRTDIIDGLGNEVMIEYIIAPRTFATPHLFNPNNTLPATFTALEDSVILMATKDSTFKVISQDPQVLHNFLCIAGNCNICTVSRLKPLSRKTVRERFIVYLFEHKKKDSLIVEITPVSYTHLDVYKRQNLP